MKQKRKYPKPKFPIEQKLLLTPDQIKPTFPKWKVEGVLNPGAIRMPNKKIMLYARIAESSIHRHNGKFMCPTITSCHKIGYQTISPSQISRKFKKVIFLKEGTCRLTHMSHFRKIILDPTGFNIEKLEQHPDFSGRCNEGNFGVEDPRIIKIGNQYIMTYVSITENEGVCTSLATSKNLKSWKRKGIIFRQQNKDVVIFPQKIKGKYIALHRPEGTFIFSQASIWISHSPDLIHWGEEKSLFQPRKNNWDNHKIGMGPPPIKTKKGWLLIYHGIDKPKDISTYHAGAVLLDSKDPKKILARSSRPLFSPEEHYEKSGFVNNVVFPTGLVPTLDKKYYLIYSGAGDSNITIRKIAIADILKSMKYF